ncbi:MAG: DUF4396 domain-containing protein [Gaiella sp.]
MTTELHEHHAAMAASGRSDADRREGGLGKPRSLMWVAAAATLHCLTGCAIGEVLGMVIGTAFGLSDELTIVLAITLAFLFGYSFTLLPLRRAGLAFSVAVPVALAADTFSITVMEIVDNVAMVTIPGAMDASLGDWLFWGSLGLALTIAFVAALPVNRYLIARGRGHAVAHEWHHAGHVQDAKPAPEIPIFRMAAIALSALAFTIGIGVTAAMLTGNEEHDPMPAHSEPVRPHERVGTRVAATESSQFGSLRGAERVWQ